MKKCYSYDSSYNTYKKSIKKYKADWWLPTAGRTGEKWRGLVSNGLGLFPGMIKTAFECVMMFTTLGPY